MKKILIDSRMISHSGIGTYLKNIISLLTEDYYFYLLGNPKDLEAYKGKENIKIIQMQSSIYSLKEQLEFHSLTKSCDIFWSPHYNIPLLPVKAKKRVVTIHDVFHLSFLEKLNLKQKIYAKVMINSAVKLSDRIITVSNFSKKEIINYTHTNERKISVIHNAVNSDIFKPLDNPLLTQVQKKYNLPDNFILFVGNVKPHKNLKKLLVAFERLSQHGLKDYSLVVVGKKEGFITGDGEVSELIKNKPGLKAKVLFTGHVENEELPILYNLASLFVFPSLYEGFGLPPLEAMACKCPAIVSSTASLPEACGNAAYYVNPYSTEDITKGINNVLTNETLRKDLIEKGLERIKLFNWEKSAEEHITIFNELLNN